MNRNSIHDIKPSAKLRKSKGYESRRLEHDDEPAPRARKRDHEVYQHPYEYESRSRGGGRAIWYVAVFCILFLVFALSFLFAGATVEITPRVGTIELSELLTATKDPLDSKALSFELASVSGEESTEVSSTEKRYIEKKATGTVRIFNNNSTAAQKLLIDTRLVTSDGKIYKTSKAVTVPGQKVEGGKTVPGTIDVAIYADAAGEDYNIPESDFKIFGFKGTPKYETIYARSIGKIEGGFKGETYALSEEEDASQRKDLEDKLRTSLLAKARAELPDGFLIYDDAVLLETETPEVKEEDGKSLMTQKGVLHAFVFKEENLTRNLVRDLVADFDKNKVYLPEIEDISVSLMSSAEITPSRVDTISLSVKGDTKVVWVVDEEALKEQLAGIKKRKFESALAEFKNIDRAALSLKPFWKNSLPTKTEQIEVINTVSQE